MMKRKLISFFLVLLLLFSLSACENDYPPVESTEEELQTVMTLSHDGKSYNIPFELYRAFFLQLKSDVDGGNSAVWSGADKEKYITKIDEMILSRICDIYSAFHIADKLGIDLYSEENEETLDEYIKASVEGGSVDSMLFAGFDGDYDAYLASLREMNLNYSAQRTLLRYALASELIDYHYFGDSSTEGAFKYTLEDVREFYESDEAARFIKGDFSKANTAMTLEEIKALRDSVAEAESAEEAAILIIQKSLTVGEDVMNGDVIGINSLDPMYYSQLTEQVFSLDVGKTGEVIEVNTGTETRYYIVYRAEKSDEHFEKCRDYITEIYINHTIGKILSEAKDALIKSATPTDTLISLDRSTVSMK